MIAAMIIDQHNHTSFNWINDIQIATSTLISAVGHELIPQVVRQVITQILHHSTCSELISSPFINTLVFLLTHVMWWDKGVVVEWCIYVQLAMVGVMSMHWYENILFRANSHACIGKQISSWWYKVEVMKHPPSPVLADTLYNYKTNYLFIWR